MPACTVRRRRSPERNAPPGSASFTNDVMAVLGKAGCNSGACHGHNSGKAGFKLSLRGYDLRADFAALLDLSGVRPKLPAVKHGLPLSRQTCATRQHKRGLRNAPKYRKVTKLFLPRFIASENSISFMD